MAKYESNLELTKKITAFYSLMYVREHIDLEIIFKEIFRVLESGGKFLVWNANLAIPKDSGKKMVVFYLEMTLPSGKKVETGYGTRKTHQKLEDFITLGKKMDSEVITQQNSNVQFFIELKRP